MTLARLLKWPGVAQCAAAAFLVAHLVVLAPGAWSAPNHDGVVSFLSFDLDDIDAINFAMGVRRFDVAQHRPHPPGYPIYVVLGKTAREAIGSLYAGHWPNGPSAAALGLLSALAGALAAFPLIRLFRLLAGNEQPHVACAALLIALTCPLYWFTASRPLSDMVGLSAALCVQALLATAFVRQTGWRDRSVSPEELASTGRLLVASALLAGFLIGLRSQTLWLTLPLLVLVIADRAGRGAAGAIVGSAITFLVGVLLWLVPLVFVSGGPVSYFTALTSQAGEDIEGVDMLLTSTQPVRRLAFNLLETFVLPWASWPLAAVVLAFAALGVVAMMRSSRRHLALLAGLAAPYAIFHLVYQENATTRYALPLVPAVAFLAARGAAVVLRRATPALAVVAAAVSLWLAVPAVVRAASPYVPVFAMFDAFATRTQREFPEAIRRTPELTFTDRDKLPAVAMHRRQWTETRRAREWSAETGVALEFPWALLPAPRGHEWLELAKHWREGRTNPIYFVADPRRTDLALIDPRSTHRAGHFAWPFQYATTFVGGARPWEMDWWVIDSPPAWFLGEGWAVTPETAGVANQDKKGPANAEGAVGWLRRDAEARRVLIGGRNLGAADAPAVRFTAELDGRTLETWDVKPNPGFFLRAIDLPAGALATAPAGTDRDEARFARLRITATAADGSSAPVAAAIEQFDVQTPDTVMFGYGGGWHEDEYNPRTGARWRWASDRAELRVWGGAGDVQVRFVVESPLQTFEDAPIVTVRAGDHELARLTPADAFTIDVRVPRAALEASGGLLTLTTDKVFVPAEHVGASDPRRNDKRRLGLRVWSAFVAPVTPPVNPGEITRQ